MSTPTLQTAFAYYQQEQYTSARLLCEQILLDEPDNPLALHFLGVVTHQLGETRVALALISKAIHHSSHHANFYLNRGRIFHQLNHIEQAIDDYTQALKLDPSPHTYFERARAYDTLGKLIEAISDYDSVIQQQANHIQAYYHRGNALGTLGHYDLARVSFEKVLQHEPRNALAHFGKGIAFEKQFQLDSAIASYTLAIDCQPNYAEAYFCRGIAFWLNQQCTEAKLNFDEATRIRADYAEAYWNKALLLLTLGEWQGGWLAYEWGKSIGKRKGISHYDAPLWLGETSLQDKTIMLHCEQGFGDALQFCRYAKAIADKGAKVILATQRELVSLFKNGLAGVAKIVSHGDPLDSFDSYCPLLSLPLACKTFSEEAIPVTIPYLFASSDKMEQWKSILGAHVQPRIGLVWNGASTYQVDENRSIPLTQFIDALPDTGFVWVSLQKELRPQDSDTLRMHPEIQHYGHQLHDFNDTAALIMNLDLVIAVDTAVAHLAGALGKPIWLLNRFDTDWRWLQHRTDSPWYPTMKIYRQPRRHDWHSVLATVKSDLLAWGKANS